MRQNAPHVLVLVTDGKAQDDVEPPSRVAHVLGQYRMPCVFVRSQPAAHHGHVMNLSHVKRTIFILA